MRLGEIVVGRGLATVAQIEEASERQKYQGGRLGTNLIAMGVLTTEQLESIIHDSPVLPQSVADTGIPLGNLINLLIKFMHLEQHETVADLSDRLKLPPSVVQNLIDEAIKRQYVIAAGSVSRGIVYHNRYTLAERGRSAALEAEYQSQYLGPAPVPLTVFQDQVMRQRITNEVIDEKTLRGAFQGLVVPDHYLEKIGPAINAGRTVLLFGPPGNGKTTMATRVAALFKDVVYIPYAVEIDGQIMKVYDPSLHKQAVSDNQLGGLATGSGLLREGFDERWVACKRPVAIAGGELTLEMLDLRFGNESKFYEAPLHVKALNGVFVIDDFGRQQVTPESLLNRWIVPMESRVDYLKLNTGKSFMIPFDGLLIFSTNLQPADLMDPAFLRRIPYKIKLFEPTRDEFRRIFEGVAKHYGLQLQDDLFAFIVERLSACKHLLAYYQPKFICEQVIEACKYANEPPRLSMKRVANALANLYVEIEDQRSSSDVEEVPQAEPGAADSGAAAAAKKPRKSTAASRADSDD